MTFINFLLAMLAIMLAIPVLVLLTQVLSAYFFKSSSQDVSIDRAFTIAVLIPAHNESAGIIDTLSSLAPQLNAQDRLIVVADNCTDDTAAIARTHGAEVIIRTNEKQRGKGYALDFGLQYLAQQPCDVLVIIDADCIIEAQSLKKLAFCSLQHHRPVQALYLMQNKNEGSIKAKVSEFAWCVKNLVRPLGFTNLGGFAKLSLPCQLMGTGMAFPWQLIKSVDLANGNIVEDMKLGIDFSLVGSAPLFYPNAKVTSYFPTASAIQQGQSKRWEHGHLAMILSEVPKLLVMGFSKRQLSTIAMALDLLVPPLALLVGVILMLTLLTGFLHTLFAVASLAFFINIFTILVLMIAIFCAWWGWGKSILGISSMLFIPIYMMLKIPNYFSFVFKRQITWNKTEREQK